MKLNAVTGNYAELLMVSFAVGVLLILFTPIPSGLLDVLLIVNFSWALMMLLLTFYIDKPLGFSTFPSLLLISTLFRLSLNISATRLILSDAEAGRVIEAMGNYVIAGNYIMGLVVFVILIIVQYIVVTNGAQRVAEVAARFTLDSMPGKQMSIDADLNMGLISQQQAQERRKALEKEANFYGAMDGASKFVKGDAIAGILIVLVDIIGGFAIGLAQKGMSWSESIHTYTLLTVGDGLVTQIPALIISTATGIIVTRAATDAQLGTEVSRQIAAHPKSLLMVCAGLIGMLCLHGMPGFPVLFILSLFAIAAYRVLKNNTNDENSDETEADNSDDSLYEQMRIHPIEIRFASEVYGSFEKQQKHFLEQIQIIRNNLALQYGMVLPAVKIKQDSGLAQNSYQIAINGNPAGSYQLFIDRVLAINARKLTKKLDGIETRDPTYGLPATWVALNDKQAASDSGFTVVDVMTVLLTHLNEVFRTHLSQLLTRDECERLLGQAHINALSDEIVPSILSISQVQKLLQGLLQEHVSIRDLETILTQLSENKHCTNPDELGELLRIALADTICRNLMTAENQLAVMTLDPHTEQQLSQGVSGGNLVLEPKMTEKFISTLAKLSEKMMRDNKQPILLCAPSLRRHIRQLTGRIMPALNILSMSEVTLNCQVESYGVVEC